LRPICPLVPVPMVVTGGSLSSLFKVSRATCLETPELLLPLEKCLSSIRRVRSIESRLRAHHVLEGSWDWGSGSFSRLPPTDTVTIEWYRRDDVPDAYIVRNGDDVVWHSLSRVWATLIASDVRKIPAFIRSSIDKIERLLPGCYLPIVVGRSRRPIARPRDQALADIRRLTECSKW
jgi:hypothetical protein